MAKNIIIGVLAVLLLSTVAGAVIHGLWLIKQANTYLNEESEVIRKGIEDAVQAEMAAQVEDVELTVDTLHYGFTAGYAWGYVDGAADISDCMVTNPACDEEIEAASYFRDSINALDDMAKPSHRNYNPAFEARMGVLFERVRRGEVLGAMESCRLVLTWEDPSHTKEETTSLCQGAPKSKAD